METIEFLTKDNVRITGFFWNGNWSKTVLLLHMMPATKESWTPLAEKLFRLEFNVLAIDFRGHGTSGGGDYHTFTPEDHQQYYLDVEAAVEFIKAQLPQTEILLGGASIGANMTIKYMANHPEVKKGVSLSAGLDYYGVRAVDDIKNLQAAQELLLVGSRDDGRNSGGNCGEMAEQLSKLSPAKTECVIYDTGGHGTDMWAPHTELLNKIVNFYIHE